MANSVWFVDALWSDQGLEIYSGLEAHRQASIQSIGTRSRSLAPTNSPPRSKGVLLPALNVGCSAHTTYKGRKLSACRACAGTA